MDASLPRELLTTLTGIAEQATSAGQEIHKLWIINGWLYPTYGDYQNNTGPLALLRVSLDDATVEDVGIIHTEATWNLRWNGADDALLPYVDPRGGPTATQHFASLSGGVWTRDQQLAPPSTADTPEHLMSACTTSHGDWLGGAAYGADPETGGAPTIWHKPTGDTWAVSLQIDEPGASGFARFYLLMPFGDEILAVIVDGEENRTFHWNGTAWTETTPVGAVADGSPFHLGGTTYWLCRVNQLDVGQVSDQPLTVVALDSGVQATIEAALPAGTWRAICATPGCTHAWLLRSDGHLFRGDSDGTFTDLGTIDVTNVRSLAVDEDANVAYLGGSTGQIWTVPLP